MQKIIYVVSLKSRRTIACTGIGFHFMRSVIAITLIICIVSCQSMPFFPILVMMPMINGDYVIPYPHLKLLHVCLIFYMFYNFITC